MKQRKWIFTGCITVALLMIVSIAWAAPQDQQQNPTSSAEYTAYQTAHDEKDAQSKIKLLDDFVIKYPDSVLALYVYQDYYLAYFLVKNYPEVAIYADKLLALGDKADVSSRLLALETREIAYSIDCDESAFQTPEAAVRARDAAMQGLKMLDQWQQPGNLTNEQFSAWKTSLRIILNSVAADAESRLKGNRAVCSTKPDPGWFDSYDRGNPFRAAPSPPSSIIVPDRPTPYIAAQMKTRINPKDALTYVWIPSGTFQMGCSPGDSKCSDYEKPARSVTITKGFWIGQTPVTQAAYKKVMDVSHSHFKGDQLPEERVTWYEAQTYCERVGMRLPTEAQWEYAARGGNPASRYGPVAQIAWYRANSGGRTHAVALKKANDYGLYDMLGDVDEWSADPFWPQPVDSNDPAWHTLESELEHPGFDMLPPSLNDEGQNIPAPKQPPPNVSRVVRGASWGNDSYFVSVSNRMRYDPENRHQNVGFRCAAN